jgi:hypothetical protein
MSPSLEQKRLCGGASELDALDFGIDLGDGKEPHQIHPGRQGDIASTATARVHEHQ